MRPSPTILTSISCCVAESALELEGLRSWLHNNKSADFRCADNLFQNSLGKFHEFLKHSSFSPPGRGRWEYRHVSTSYKVLPIKGFASSSSSSGPHTAIISDLQPEAEAPPKSGLNGWNNWSNGFCFSSSRFGSLSFPGLIRGRC